MNCTAFEKRLERYQAGTLSEAERRDTDQHLFQCAACRALYETLQSGEHQMEQMDLYQAVLSRTTGPACNRCRSVLGDLVDGVLEGVESELVRSHLGSCPACSSLFRVMTEMAEVLPQMREISPGPSFVSEVLNCITPLRHARFGLSGILDFFRGLTERPRFSWEAAYLGTLLVFGLFGTPFSPVHDASSRLLASLQSPEGLIAKADSSIQEWRQDAEIVIGASGRARQTLGRMASRSADTVELILADGGYYLRKSEERLASAGKAVRTTVAEVYQQAKGTKPSPKR